MANDPFGGHRRTLDGSIVTLKEVESGRLVVMHRRGISVEGKHGMPARRYGVIQGIRDLLADVDRWPGTWRVLSISTPSTIYQDLQGRHGPPPELDLLAKAGRLDMWIGSHQKASAA